MIYDIMKTWRKRLTQRLTSLFIEQPRLHRVCYISYIGHKDFLCLTLVLPPLDSKQGGLESSGQILISANSKTKSRAFFVCREIKKSLKSLEKKNEYFDICFKLPLLFKHFFYKFLDFFMIFT